MEESAAARPLGVAAVGAAMNRLFSVGPASRARWFDELHQALEEATLLLAAIAAEGRGGTALAALQARILAVRAEVELLNIVNTHSGCRIIGSAWPLAEDTGMLPN